MLLIPDSQLSFHLNNKMAINEELNQRIRNIFGKHPEITEKRMFGGVCFMHNGNMVCGSDMSGLMLRVGPDQ